MIPILKEEEEENQQKISFEISENFSENSIFVKIKPSLSSLINPNNENSSPEASQRKQTRLPKGLPKKEGVSFRGARIRKSIPPPEAQLFLRGNEAITKERMFIGENSRVAIILARLEAELLRRIKWIESLLLGLLVNRGGARRDPFRGSVN